MTPLMQYGFKDLFRDRMGFFFCLVFPLVMTVFLGNMLTSYDNPDAAVDAIEIAYVSEAPAAGTGEYSGVDIFVDALKGNDKLRLSESADIAAAKKSVDSGESDTAMLFDTSMDITIYKGKDSIKNRVAQLLAQSFSREYAAWGAAYKSEAFAARLQQAGASAVESAASPKGLTEDRDLGVNRTMIDFYAVSLIVMIAFMGGGIGGATTMYLSRVDGVMRRMTMAPKRRHAIFIEYVIGMVPTNILQSLIMMVPCALVFGAHYAKTAQDNILLFAYFVLLGTAVTSVFMLVGLFLKANPTMPIMAAMWALLFISGTFNREIYIEGVTEIMPMNIAQQAAFDLTMFGRPERVLTVMAVCACLLV
ncbi:MAG: ABC transporter permease, partial [Clostridiales Family XIII bacterium]|nr:ABC transporter permease [Clostridiales Family XIII bacterium]